jgi:hypothetical protein
VTLAELFKDVMDRIFAKKRFFQNSTGKLFPGLKAVISIVERMLSRFYTFKELF